MAARFVSNGGVSATDPGPKNEAGPKVGPPMTSLRTGVHAAVTARPINDTFRGQRRIKSKPLLCCAVADFMVLMSLIR